MSHDHPRIYISHAWGGESEDIVREVVHVFEDAGLPVIYDKKDLGYRQSIQDFMVNLGQADVIIIVVSNKYLHSEYCMFELLQIYDNNRVLDRIFPIVLEEVQIAKSTQRLELVKYWEQETTQLEEKIRELGSIAHIEGIADDLNLYQTIRNRIARLTAILKDINTLNIQIHRKSDYADLLAAVKQKLETLTAAELESGEKSQMVPPIASRTTPQKRRLIWPWMLITAAAILAFVGFKWWAAGSDLKGHEVPMEVVQQESKMEPLIEGSDTEKPVEAEPARLEQQPSTPGSEALPIRKPPALKKADQINNPNEQISEPTAHHSSSLSTSGETAPPVSVKSDEPKVKPIEKKQTSRTVDLNIPKQMIRVVLASTLSSDRNQAGDEVQLTAIDEVKIGPHIVIRPGAMIRGEVTRAKSSLNGVKGELAFRMKDVRTENGQWMELSYPEYSDSRRGEVIFPKGTELANVVLKEARLTWTTDQ